MVMFQRFRYYKHERNTDVCIYVLHRFYIKETDEYSVRLRWFNCVNPKNVFDLGVQETVRIKRTDAAKWKDYDVAV